MAMAMAPGLTKIVVFEGNPNDYIPNDILNSMLSDSNTVKNLSCSWGWSGGPSTTTAHHFHQHGCAGPVVFQRVRATATRSRRRQFGQRRLTIPSLDNAPSSCPIITQVGGTTLTMNGAGGVYASETVWNWGLNQRQ